MLRRLGVVPVSASSVVLFLLAILLASVSLVLWTFLLPHTVVFHNAVLICSAWIHNGLARSLRVGNLMGGGGLSNGLNSSHLYIQPMNPVTPVSFCVSEVTASFRDIPHLYVSWAAGNSFLILSFIPWRSVTLYQRFLQITHLFKCSHSSYYMQINRPSLYYSPL